MWDIAARNAGLDPNNSLLASSYYDLYTQSPRSAGRFLNQLSRLRRAGVTPAGQFLIDARGIGRARLGISFGELKKTFSRREVSSRYYAP